MEEYIEDGAFNRFSDIAFKPTTTAINKLTREEVDAYLHELTKELCIPFSLDKF